jgi:hypothetical protein
MMAWLAVLFLIFAGHPLLAFGLAAIIAVAGA